MTKISQFVAAIILVVFFVFPVQAVEMRGELILNKGPLLEIDTLQRTPVCESLLDFHAGKDQPNFFNYRDNNCQGRYTFTLRGKPGSTVTLFGNVDYRKERGYLIVRKTDEKEIWLTELESIPANQWVKREAENGYGGYEAYFASAPQFSQNIASVKWGHWWGQEVPEGAH